MSAEDDRLERLKRRIGTVARLPTSALGRARRGATAAVRLGLGRAAGTGDAELFEQLAVQLGELKGLAMKAGQVLSYVDTELPDEAKRLLAVLQVRSQPTPFEEIEEVVPKELLPTLEREPVATASVGQVHRATLPDGTRVAVKVRHPGIEQALAADFRAAAAASALPGLFIPNISMFIEEAKGTFLAECDYVAEAEHQRRFGALWAGDPDVEIPQVHPRWCSERVLVTSWVDGLSFERFAATASQAARDRAGRALYAFYVGSVYRHGLFNGDPHPGNLVFAEDGRLTVLDFGCVKVLSEDFVQALAALSRAVRADDEADIRAALRRVGADEPDAQRYPGARRFLRAFYAPALVGGPHVITRGLPLDMKALAREKLALSRLKLPAKLLFLLRVRFGLHSELVRLESCCDWAGLEAALVSGAPGERRG